MAIHPNSKVIILNGKVKTLELWANHEDGVAFCKIKITRETTRFRVETNYLGDGKLGLNCPKTIELAVAGFEKDLDLPVVIRLFTESNLSVREWTDIMGPDYKPEMKG